MAKIKLGARPKSFKRTVKFPTLDGSEGSIECSFVYRTRTEFGKFIDDLLKAGESRPGEDMTMADLMAKTAKTNAEYLLKVLDGWDLDEPLNLETVQQLADECPAAVNAIMDAYRESITEGRLGN